MTWFTRWRVVIYWTEFKWEPDNHRAAYAMTKRCWQSSTCRRIILPHVRWWVQEPPWPNTHTHTKTHTNANQVSFLTFLSVYASRKTRALMKIVKNRGKKKGGTREILVGRTNGRTCKISLCTVTWKIITYSHTHKRRNKMNSEILQKSTLWKLISKTI